MINYYCFAKNQLQIRKKNKISLKFAFSIAKIINKISKILAFMGKTMAKCCKLEEEELNDESKTTKNG